MSNRHERRKAAVTSRKKLAKLKTATLDQHLDDTLGRVRAEFERTGEIHPRFECLTDGESFQVPASWPDRSAKAAACGALRDTFRRRGVNRYVFASEAWAGKTPGLLPTDDPDRGELVCVIAVERNGPRRYASAEITRNGETATLGPWEVKGESPPSWLLELLEEGHSDRAPKAEPPPVGRLSAPDFQSLVDEDPEQAADFRDSVEIHDQLGDLMADQVQKDANADPLTMFMALESVLRGIVTDMGSPKDIGAFARFLRDHPDHFPMFSTVPDQVPSTEHFRRCKATLRRFICEKREVGQTDSAIFGAFMNMYMYLGSQAIGALNLARRIEDWEAKELLRKMEQVKGVAPQTDKIKEIWELEDWGHDEWAEQVMAEIAFALAMNVRYVPERNNLYGNVAGYQVRRAPNGLVLVPSDSDEDIFVAVRAERTNPCACVLGWLRGSEGKLPQFYQKNCWVIPPEALHDMEKLPGKERLPIG